MFPTEGVAFFKALEKHNEREWFQPRKEIYEAKVKAPMFELVEAINAELLGFAPLYIAEPKKAVFRIYRDTRFSKDKTPYKTHIGAFFPRHGMNKNAGAGYYVQISAKGVGIAGGAYSPGPDELRKLREFIAADPQPFLKPNKLMGALKGESLQRPPKGFDAEHPAIDLIKMKQWYYWTELGVDVATSPKLKQEIVKRFKSMAAVLDLLNKPLAGKR
jgi:uncharacterized protein (TIGR02453 family)